MTQTIVLSCAHESKAGPYIEALKAGGLATEEIQVVTPTTALAPRELAAEAGGVVLGGGEDVDPRRYGEEPLPEARLELTPERDELEWELLAGAREGATPVWGICRGLQVINVFFGGSLWQDIPLQFPGEVLHQREFPKDALIHSVQVIEDELPLGDLLARETTMVNSRHHQGIKDLADGLLPVAVSPDGLIEVIALPDARWWVRAVQWHPEDLIHVPPHLALWREFRAAVREAQARKASAPSV